MYDLKGLIGIPFIDGGRDERTGLDCWGLIQAASARYGRKVPEFTIGAFEVERIDEAVREGLGMVERIDDPEPGCVVLMRTSREMPDAITHFGVYVGEGKFLHTRRKVGSCLSSIHDNYWSRKIWGFYRWKM